MAASAAHVKKSKALVLSIPTADQGPRGVPLVISTVDAPGSISGTVNFDCNYDCKGDSIIIHYTARAVTQWREVFIFVSESYRGTLLHDEQIIHMELRHPREGIVQAGQYSCSFHFPIDASTMPSSYYSIYDSMVYSVRVTLVRRSPSMNVSRYKAICVVNSILPRPQMPFANTPMAMTRFKGTLNKVAPYVCVIPSDILYLGQPTPVSIKFMPAEFPVRVVSAVIKLKQYTKLSLSDVGAKKSYKSTVLATRLKNEWPVAEAHKSWQRTVVVHLPGASKLTPSFDSAMVTKTHILKLIMVVRMGENGTKHKMRVEMPVTITGPRPPGELYPSFDLNRCLTWENRI
ncbi:hypothetical protein BGZ67_002757 [Mortierella alpina]|nr:hypothetical protein BGZ67_002757 [Mortierella alpina]